MATPAHCPQVGQLVVCKGQSWGSFPTSLLSDVMLVEIIHKGSIYTVKMGRCDRAFYIFFLESSSLNLHRCALHCLPGFPIRTEPQFPTVAIGCLPSPSPLCRLPCAVFLPSVLLVLGSHLGVCFWGHPHGGISLGSDGARIYSQTCQTQIHTCLSSTHRSRVPWVLRGLQGARCMRDPDEINCQLRS